MLRCSSVPHGKCGRNFAIGFANNDWFKAIIMFSMTAFKCGSTLMTLEPKRIPIITLFMRDGVFWFLAVLRNFFVLFDICRLHCPDSAVHSWNSAVGQRTSDIGTNSRRVRSAMIQCDSRWLTARLKQTFDGVGASSIAVWRHLTHENLGSLR